MSRHLLHAVRCMLLTSLTALSLLLTACGGSSSGGGTYATPSLTGFVQDTSATGGTIAVGSATVALRRVSDNSLVATTTTDAAGQYLLTGLPQNVALVATVTPPAPQTAGFGQLVRRFPSARTLTLDNALRTRIDFQVGSAVGYDADPTLATTLGATSGGVATGGSQVDLPANALVRADGTTLPTGDVSVFIRPIDVAAFAGGPAAATGAATLDEFPGSMTGVRTDDSSTTLASFGAITVEFFDKADNAPLNLAAGQTATVRIDVPASLQATAPATIPLWWFNTATGLWEEEGTATLDVGGTYYAGTVNHFSTWNADIPVTVAQVTGKLQYLDGAAAAGVVVRLSGIGYGYQRFGVTNASGNFSIPAQRNMSVALAALLDPVWNNASAIAVGNDATFDAGTLVLDRNLPIAGDTVVTRTFSVTPGTDVGLFIASGTMLEGFDEIRGTDLMFTINSNNLQVSMPFTHGTPGSGDPTNGIQRVTGTTFAALVTAPASGYQNPACFSAPPACTTSELPFTVADFTSVYVVHTAAGFYGKLQVTSAVRDAGTGVYTVTVKYKVALDGTRSL